jgi:acyl-CoA oxidase
MANAPETRSRPDADALRRTLEGDHAELRRQILELLSTRAFAYRPGLDRTAYRRQVMRWLRRLADEGMLNLGYPKETGGRGDVAGGIAAFETVAFHDLSLLVKLGVQVGLFGGAIAQLGTARHHRAYLRDAGSLALPGCFAMTETGHGSNVRELRTRARYEPQAGEFVIDTPDRDARKDYIGNAAVDGRAAVVFAQLEVAGEHHGVHAFFVPIRDARGRPRAGVRIEDCGEKLGLNGVDNGRLAFDGVRVPREALLDRFAQVDADGAYRSAIADPSRRFFTMLGALIQGRVCVAAAGVSATKSALTIAVRYGARRRQFGPPETEEVPVLDYLSHQRRLLIPLATTYALHFAVRDLAAAYAASQGRARMPVLARRRLEAQAAGIKAYATWHATSAIQACREACGGAGYLAANRLAALKADTDVFTTFEGDNTVLLQLVAKGLLTDYKEELSDMDLVETVRFVASRAFDSIAEAVPTGIVASVLAALPGRDGDETAMRDRRFQMEAMTFREEHLLHGLGRRLKRAMDRGADPFDAFNRAQDHVVATARAHVELRVLATFERAAARVRARATRETLGRLVDLYALSRIEADRGWFLEHGFLSPARSKAVVRTVNELCAEIRPEAELLVGAFGIPDALIGAPIGAR